MMEYAIRQGSAGPPGKKARFLDAFKAQGCRPSPAQLKARGARRISSAPSDVFDRHNQLLSWLPRRKSNQPALKSDLDLLREAHRFLRDDVDEDGSWEAQLARRYYDRLFREYVICDLAGYKRGDIGFRWRTEAEVVQGRGQFHCGHKICRVRSGLKSYEVDFKYLEAGADKRALVKIRLCDTCAYKLHYRRLKAERKRLRRGGRERPEKRAVEDPKAGSGGVIGVDSGDESSASEARGAAGSRGQSSGRADEAASGDDPQSLLQPSDADKQRLASLVWKGPDPDARTREDDFDDYFQGLFM